ncbi:hypothetical protein BSKO_02504 [Bryopsis sp. KO-2023]|nr:hypothetical protein BSKO_02504 [Bryopsis sp. KO-2023]
MLRSCFCFPFSRGRKTGPPAPEPPLSGMEALMDSRIEDEWDLPSDIIARILASFSAKEVVNFACVASPCMVAVKNDPTLRKKVDLEKSWRCGDGDPFTFGLSCFSILPVFARRNNLIGLWDVDVIKIWDIRRREIMEVVETGEGCSFLCLLEDVVLSGHQEGYICVWSIKRNMLTSRFKAHFRRVTCIVEMEHMVASVGDDDRFVQLWIKGTWECEEVLGQDSDVRTLASSDNGKILLAALSDSTIHVWDISTRTRVHILKGYSSFVLPHPDWEDFILGGTLRACEDWVLSGVCGKKAQLWSLKDGESKGTYPCSMDEWVVCVDVDLNDGRLAVGSSCGTINVWDTAEREVIKSIHTERRPIGLWIERSELIVVDDKGWIKIWDFLPC